MDLVLYGLLSGKIKRKADLVNGKIPESQLPSYVDDVLEFTSIADFPTPGEEGKIYVALDTNNTYRWTGSAYIMVGGGGVTAMIATPFSEDEVYGTRDLVVYGTKVYRCVEEGTTGPWDEEKWVETNLGDELEKTWVEIGVEGQTEPSDDLEIGGLFFERM